MKVFKNETTKNHVLNTYNQLLDMWDVDKEEGFFCIGNDGNGIVTVRFTMRNENIRILGAGILERREIQI